MLDVDEGAAEATKRIDMDPAEFFQWMAEHQACVLWDVSHQQKQAQSAMLWDLQQVILTLGQAIGSGGGRMSRMQKLPCHVLLGRNTCGILEAIKRYQQDLQQPRPANEVQEELVAMVPDSLGNSGSEDPGEGPSTPPEEKEAHRCWEEDPQFIAAQDQDTELAKLREQVARREGQVVDTCWGSQLPHVLQDCRVWYRRVKGRLGPLDKLLVLVAYR
ncbi:UNVERIFIED_CONTAM: hypothetical protein K2H54_060001 [Gekko kuhli]